MYSTSQSVIIMFIMSILFNSFERMGYYQRDQLTSPYITGSRFRSNMTQELTTFLLYALSLFLIICGFQWIRKRQRFLQKVNKLPSLPKWGYGLGHLPVLWTELKHGRTNPGQIVLYLTQAGACMYPYNEIGITPLWLGPVPIIALYRPETVEVSIRIFC